MTKRNAIAREVSGYRDAKVAGDFYFTRHGEDPEPIGMFHTCPCGCGSMGSLYFSGRRPKEWGPGAEWTVTGTWPKATLQPSIGFMKQADGSYHWHGFLRDGVFEEC